MKNLLRGLSISASALAIMAPAAAVAQESVYQFNIPAQDLGAALRAFGQQSGQQLGFDASIARGKQSTALAGGYSADEGLRRLLDGTGLNFERSPAGVLVVQDPNSPIGVTDSTSTCAAAVQRNGRARVPSQIYTDAYLTYDFDDTDRATWLANTQLTLSVHNVFDEDPPAIATTFDRGYSTFGDPRLRRFMITLRKHFGG
jgi:hypothetical protein